MSNENDNDNDNHLSNQFPPTGGLGWGLKPETTKEQMKLNDNDNKLLMLVMTLFTLAMIAMYSYRQQIDTIKANQQDIDRRITNIEQSLNQSDTAIVNLYQHLNEIRYIERKRK